MHNQYFVLLEFTQICNKVNNSDKRRKLIVYKDNDRRAITFFLFTYIYNKTSLVIMNR